MPIGTALLLACFLASFPRDAFSDMCQVLQADKALRVRVHNAPTDGMVAILFQPSLSSADDDESSCRRTSAFLLQPFSQARIMVGPGPGTLARIERCIMGGASSDCQIALSHIDADYPAMAFGCWLCYLKLKREQQVELLLGLIIPQFGSSDMRILLYQGHVVSIACVGHNHAPIQGQDAHLVSGLQAVIPVVVIGQRGRNILGGLIQALVAFLGDACFAERGVLLHLGPERLIGGSNLTGNITGHLGRQAVL